MLKSRKPLLAAVIEVGVGIKNGQKTNPKNALKKTKRGKKTGKKCSK